MSGERAFRHRVTQFPLNFRPLRADERTVARRALLTAALCACALLAPLPVAAGTHLLVGVDDDSLKWSASPRNELAIIRDLGVKAVRVTVPWHPGQVKLATAERRTLDRVVVPGFGLRIVLAIYGRAVDAPQDDASRNQFCSYLADVLHSYPSVGDVVVWNEPNASRFWRPQYDSGGVEAAPASYEALLARCWDVLHSVRPGVNVIAATAPRGNDDPARGTHSSINPGTWYRLMGSAYKQSGRRLPIFDTVGHNAYPTRTSERPWVRHLSTAIGQGDYEKLMQAMTDAFAGTGQPVPGQGRVTIWYMEQGFQSTLDPAKAPLYSGKETDRFALPPYSARTTASADGPAPDQATQLFNAVQLAYCQPAVGAFFNFELADEPSLGGWQSGVLWTDFTPKPSYWAFKQAIGTVRDRTVDCRFYTQAGATQATQSSEPGVQFTGPKKKR
jgi:hypothetical protein